MHYHLFIRTKLVFGLFISVLMIAQPSCVSKKKYREAEAALQKKEIVERSRENQIESLQLENQMLRNEISSLRQQNGSITDNGPYRGATGQPNNEWQQRYEQLEQDYQRLQYNSNLEAQQNRQNQRATQTQNQPGYNTYPSTTTPTYPNQNPTYTSPNTNYPASSTPAYTPNNPNTPGANLNAYPTTNSPNSATLYSLQEQITNNLSVNGFSQNEVKQVVTNGHLYVYILDDLLYQKEANYSLSSRGQQALSSVSTALQNRPVSQLLIACEAGDANGTPIGYQKAQQVGNFLSQQGLNYEIHEKSFAPLAFETTGTGVKHFYSVVIVDLL